MNKWIRYALIAFVAVCLILVRKFEIVLFYDPFLKYFQGPMGREFYPEYDLMKVMISVTFRYAINAFLSLMIIALAFRRKSYVKFAMLIYLVFLVLLLPLYMYLATHYFELGENIGFYIRRLLIQPLLLLILIPAFYYLKIEKGSR